MFNRQVNPFLGQFAEAFVGGELRPDCPHLVRSNKPGRALSLVYITKLRVGAVLVWGNGILTATSLHSADVVLSA